ncbi:hypothetical protein OY671_012889, partial [Metschnikowia pulcherrima]
MTASSPIETAAQTASTAVGDPSTGQDWVSTRHLKSSKVDGGRAVSDIASGYPARSLWPAYTESVRQALSQVPGITDVQVNWSTQIQTHAASRGQALSPG